MSKHRLFAWLDAAVLPDHQLIVFARSDDCFLGVLQSQMHAVWALATCGRLETRPQYTPTTSFETFPLSRPTMDSLRKLSSPWGKVIGTFHVHPPYTQVTPSKEKNKGDLPKLTALQELYSQMLGKQVKAWGLIAMPEPDKDCAVELFLYDEGAVWPSTNIRIKYK